MVAQDDGQPCRGCYPTSLWSEGEIVADQHCVRIGEECSVRPCELYGGMYRLSSLERLAVFTPGGNRVTNDEILLEARLFD